MNVSNKEVILLLSGDEFLNEQVKAYAQTLSLPVNIQKQVEHAVSSTIYEVILENSHSDPMDLVDHTAPEYEKVVQGHAMDLNSWATLLQHYPRLLKVPIAVRGEEVMICDSPSKIQHLDKG